MLGYSNPPQLVVGIWEWDPKKPEGVGHDSGMAARKGKVYVWNGGRSVHVWKQKSLPKPDFAELKNEKSAQAPSRKGRIYSKWWYLKEHDVFVGLTANYQDPVWVYRPPAD
jgi:hypothetical protein